MRRTALLVVLAALVLPASAMAVKAAAGDGTLSVRNGDGYIRLALDRGVAIGRIGSGTLTLIAPANDDCTTPLVWDDGERADPVEKTVVLPTTLDVETRCIYRGDNMRFRLVGRDADAFVLRGDNIGLSSVGRGSGRIKGDGGFFDGTWSLNGEDYVSLPDEARVFSLAAAPEA